jgi:RNA-binding protein YhbY
MVKVKILKTALADVDAKHFAQKIAEQAGAALVEIRGHKFMLYKSRKK